MVKVFVAQTHEHDRGPLCDFLKAAGHDARPHNTDMSSLVWLTRELMFSTDPSVIVSSQRDLLGHPYISNMLHAVAFNLHVPTLTIVYSRAAAHQEHMVGVVRFMAALGSTPEHQLKIVPKVAEDTVAAEHGTVLSYINGFSQNLAVK